MKTKITILLLFASLVGSAQMGIIDFDTINVRSLQVDSAIWLQSVPTDTSSYVLIRTETNQIKVMNLNSRDGYYEHEISADGNNVVNLPWSLRSSSMIFLNSKLLRKQFTSGTDQLTINLPVKKYEYVTIIR